MIIKDRSETAMPKMREVFAIRRNDDYVFAVSVTKVSKNQPSMVDEKIIQELQEMEKIADSRGIVFHAFPFDPSLDRSKFMKSFTEMIASFIASDRPPDEN